MLPGELWGEVLFANLVGRYIFSREVSGMIYIFPQTKFPRLKQKLYILLQQTIQVELQQDRTNLIQVTSIKTENLHFLHSQQYNISIFRKPFPSPQYKLRKPKVYLFFTHFCYICNACRTFIWIFRTCFTSCRLPIFQTPRDHFVAFLVFAGILFSCLSRTSLSSTTTTVRATCFSRGFISSTFASHEIKNRSRYLFHRSH